MSRVQVAGEAPEPASTPFKSVQSTLMQLLSEVVANVTMAVAFTTTQTPAGVGVCWTESPHSRALYKATKSRYAAVLQLLHGVGDDNATTLQRSKSGGCRPHGRKGTWCWL